MRTRFYGLALLGILALNGTAAAQTVIYTNQAAFLANVFPGYYLNTFNSLPLGTVPSPQNFSSGGFSYAASAANNFFNVGSVADVWLSTNIATDPIGFTMSGSNITAVGGFFFLTDFGGNVTTGSITVQLNDGTMHTLVNPPSNGFVGFTTTIPIVSLTATSDGISWPTVNDFIVGTSVPEPTTWAMIAVGAVGAAGGVWRYRRRRNQALEETVTCRQ